MQPAAAGARVIHLPPHMTAFGASAQPLPHAVRQKMESFFRADLGDVRIHVGPEASRLGALAFTQGAHIYFAPGQYNPDTPHGQQLLGHELAHVQQQRSGRVRSPFASGVSIVQDPALEAEAERSGRMAAAHRPPLQCSPVPGAPLSSVPLGRGHVRIHAGPRAQSIGSVEVRSAGAASAEVTDLRVDAGHRSQGLGPALLSSAMTAALRMGKQTVRLSAEDNGSGRLTAWYRRLGFQPVGRDHRGLARLEAPIRSVLPRMVQARMALPGSAGPACVVSRSVVQRAAAAAAPAKADAKLSLAAMAREIHELLGLNPRAAAATTIAVAQGKSGLICTSNDVSKISDAATARAKELGAAAGVEQAGAGFHAEMWMLVDAFTRGASERTVSAVVRKVGASRACCGYCSTVLRRCGIAMEQESKDIYKSWVNPLTTSEKSGPLADFASRQSAEIPDFRQHATNYWWTDASGKFTKVAPGSGAK